MRKNKWSKKRKGIVAGTALLMAVTMTGALLFQHKSNASTGSTPSVSSAQVTTGNISTTITGTGSLANGSTTDIMIPTGLVIDQVLVSSGDQVKKGDKLATVNEASIASVILEIQEKLDSVEDSIDDLSDDADTEGTTEYYQSKVLEAQKDNLEEVLTTLKKMLKTKAITATSDGTITSINVSAGNEVGTTGSTNTNSSVSTNSSASSASLTKTAAVVKSSYTVRLLSTNDSSEEVSTNAENSIETSSTETNTAEEITTEENSTEAESTEDTTSESEEKETSATEAQNTQSDNSNTSNSTSAAKEESSTASDKKKTQNNTGNTENQKENSSDSTASNGKTGMPSGGQTMGGSFNQGQAAAMSGGSANSAVISAGSTETTTSTTVEYNTYETAAFSFASDDQVVVSIDVDELDISSVSLGQTAKITLDALEGQELEGTITNISSTASQGTSSVKYPVEITLEKTSDMILGMSASATIYVEESENALLIPVTALQEKGNKTFVYTTQEKDGTLSGETEVETGLSDGSQVEITSGLSEGDTVYYTKAESSDSDSMKNAMGQMGGDGQGRPDGNMPFGGQMPSGGPDGNNN